MRKLAWAAGSSFLVYLALKLIDELTDGWVSRALLWLGRQFWSLANRPVGAILLIFFLILAAALSLVFLMAWWETRPKKVEPEPEPEPAEPAKPPPLSADELHKIQDARVLWRDTGNAVSGDVQWLLDGVMRKLTPSVRLAEFLFGPVEAIRKSRESLDEVLRDNAQVPLMEVTGCLAGLYERYLNGVKWLHECSDTHGVDLEADPRYRHWKNRHPVFVAEMIKLSHRAGYAALRYPTQNENAHEIRFKKVET